jgi:hypothetical protein
MMSTWVIPYVDQDISFWEEIADRFGMYVKEVYFPVFGGVIASGRSKQPEKFMETFLRYAPLSKSVLVNRLYHDLNCLGHKTRFLGILPVFLGSKRHFCADSLPLVEKNVAQN